MEQNGHNESAETRDMLYLVGGVALIVLGAGLVITHPTVRKTVSDGLSAVLPDLQSKLMPDMSMLGTDIQRYMKLRAM